jgi:hypothetical protein
VSPGRAGVSGSASGGGGDGGGGDGGGGDGGGVGVGVGDAVSAACRASVAAGPGSPAAALFLPMRADSMASSGIA